MINTPVQSHRLNLFHLTPWLLAVVALACSAQTATPPTAELKDRHGKPFLVPFLEPFVIDLLGAAVDFGGSWEYSDERRSNFDLAGAGVREHRARMREHEIKLEARARLGVNTQALLQVVGLHETRLTHRETRRTTGALERGQMWLQQDRMGGTPCSLQAGRVKLIDRHAWWWEEEIDALRARCDSSAWRLDTGIARELLRKSSAESSVQAQARGVTRFFGQATWQWSPRHALDAFWLVHDDGSSRPARGTVFRDEDETDPSDLRARWWGLRAAGVWRVDGGPRLAYRADTAWLSGHDHVTAYDEQLDGTFRATGASGHRVHGSAFDIGATISLPALLRSSFTLGHARGSPRFRQTGLHENKTRFGGVKRWRRYGELLQPELSNLSITSLGAGVHVLGGSSIELMAHRQRQVRASAALHHSRLPVAPQGNHRKLGQEVNLLLALRETRDVEFTLAATHFKPGHAFAPDRRQPARAVELGVTVNF